MGGMDLSLDARLLRGLDLEVVSRDISLDGLSSLPNIRHATTGDGVNNDYRRPRSVRPYVKVLGAYGNIDLSPRPNYQLPMGRRGFPCHGRMALISNAWSRVSASAAYDYQVLRHPFGRTTHCYRRMDLRSDPSSALAPAVAEKLRVTKFRRDEIHVSNFWLHSHR
jgi:hypothetical protein